MNRATKMKYNELILLLSIASAFVLSGCNGSSDDETPNPEPVAKDTKPPVIDLIGNSTIEVVFNATFGDLGAVAKDETDGVVPLVSEGYVDTKVPGSYSIVYSTKDVAGNTSRVTRKVVVKEDTSLSSTITTPRGPLASFFDGVPSGADYWSEEPKMLFFRLFGFI